MFKIYYTCRPVFRKKIKQNFLRLMQIIAPTDSDFKQIRTFIKMFELDDRALDSKQFLAAYLQQELTGFGRIRNFETCSELCSLGVIEPQRLKGIGRQLVKSLVKEALQPLYLVCIIPEYFKPLGFITVSVYPDKLQDKLNYCTRELAAPENYVVMKHEDRY